MNWCFLFQCFLLGIISEINPIKLHKMCKTCTATILLGSANPQIWEVFFTLSSLPYQWKGFISFYFILAQNLSKVLSSPFCDYVSISVIILHHDFNYLHFKDLCTWMSLLYNEMMVLHQFYKTLGKKKNIFWKANICLFCKQIQSNK